MYIYMNCVLLSSAALSRDSNLTRAFRSKMGDAQVLVLKLQVCVFILLLQKKQKASLCSFHWNSKGRKVNKQNCFRGLAGKHSSSTRQGEPTNLQNSAGASKDTVVLQLMPRTTRKHHRALNCSSPHVMMAAARFEGERREMEREKSLRDLQILLLVFQAN